MFWSSKINNNPNAIVEEPLLSFKITTVLIQMFYKRIHFADLQISILSESTPIASDIVVMNITIFLNHILSIDHIAGGRGGQ